MPLWKQSVSRKHNKKEKQIARLKSDCNLFSQLYIASLFHDGDFEDFFTHENQPWPPLLSEHGKLRLPTKKSDLLKCIGMECSTTEPELLLMLWYWMYLQLFMLCQQKFDEVSVFAMDRKYAV